MSTAAFEHAYYIGSYMGGILYGVYMVMYFMTVDRLMRRKAKRLAYKMPLFFSTALMLLLTIDISVNAVWAEIMWINARDQPGGVPVYIATQLSDWYQAWGSSAAVALVLLSDALLIYRLFVIYGNSYLIVVFPILIYIGATVFSVLELVASFSPGGFFFGKKSVNFGTPYYSMSIGLNILVTALICYRLSRLARMVQDSVGEANAKLYTGISAILIESAAPYSLMGIVFLIPYARGDTVAVALGQVWAKFTCIAPQLILLRVASGNAWSSNTTLQVSSNMRFAARVSRRAPDPSTFELSEQYGDAQGDTLAGSSSTKSRGLSATSLPWAAIVKE